MKNIKDLSKRVADRVKLPCETINEVVKTVFEEMSEILVNEREEIRIKNFGTFKFGKIPGKTTKHPTTKEPIVIGDKKTIRLGLSTKIKRGLNNE